MSLTARKYAAVLFGESMQKRGSAPGDWQGVGRASTDWGGTAESLGVRCWQGMTGRVFDRLGVKDGRVFGPVGGEGGGGFCAWGRRGWRGRAEASTCW